MEQRSSGGNSEMLSFSFDTEILSLFWGMIGKSQQHPSSTALSTTTIIESPSSRVLPLLTGSSSQFLQLLVFPKSEGGIYPFLHYSVTIGVLTIVGVSSYFSYNVLTKAREKLIRSHDIQLPKSHNHHIVNEGESSLALTPSSPASISISQQQRPDSLSLSVISSNDNLRQYRIVSRRGYRSVMSGDEPDDEEEEEMDPAEVESEYFGPATDAFSGDEIEEELEDERFGYPIEPPISPTDSAYTSEYETIIGGRLRI